MTPHAEFTRRLDGVDSDIAECRETLEALLRERLALMNEIVWRDVLEAFREELKQDRPHDAAERSGADCGGTLAPERPLIHPPAPWWQKERF